jgi:hypothetical protein
MLAGPAAKLLPPPDFRRTIRSGMTSQELAFHDFAGFAAQLKGDEKSEAQTFSFHLLEAFGHDANFSEEPLLRNHCPVKSIIEIGRRRVAEFKRRVGPGEIRQRCPAGQVRRNLNVSVQIG